MASGPVTPLGHWHTACLGTWPDVAGWAAMGQNNVKDQHPVLQKLIMVALTAGDKKKNLNSQKHSNRYHEEPK